ncbi:SDR family oxidoreductase [Cupriavidus necator]|uniref:SDR family oxidoreductase n=1 Tax=Cupriavidus necator TaxID=106590 RepID=UPI0005B50D23|nr:SDR family oxidoreductase [Cupriavidus necator]
MGTGKAIRRTALITNGLGYAGLPAVHALLGAGFKVLVQEHRADDPSAWSTLLNEHPEVVKITESNPPALIEAAWEVTGRVDAIVSNDHFPAPQMPAVSVSLGFFRDTIEALVVEPFSLIQSAAPRLRKQGGGNVIFITSCRTRAPIGGATVADAARAAANAMVRSVALEFAAEGIAINAIAPNFLYSEAYYPRSIFVEHARGREYIAQQVPAQRMGRPQEIGEVISFLATTNAKFLTGAIIDFAGGWPATPPRPMAV